MTEPAGAGGAPGGPLSHRVAVLGAAGRMGQEVVRAVLAAPPLVLSALVDPSLVDPSLVEPSLVDPAAPRRALATVPPARAPAAPAVVTAVEELDPAGVDVAVDFTVAGAARRNAEWCAANGVHLVCGTTGLGADDLARLAELFSGGPEGSPRRPNAVVAANFAVSAVLMMRFAELAAPFFDGVEIIELHHASKADAPSGTALETARRIVASRERCGGAAFVSDPTRTGLDGARGARLGGDASGPVQVHSVRLPGLVAHQEVLFGAAGQSLSIRQDSYDRSSFMPGVLLAVREVANRPGLTVGLESLLGI